MIVTLLAVVACPQSGTLHLSISLPFRRSRQSTPHAKDYAALYCDLTLITYTSLPNFGLAMLHAKGRTLRQRTETAALVGEHHLRYSTRSAVYTLVGDAVAPLRKFADSDRGHPHKREAGRKLTFT